jgi:uncharacterized membrane protein
VIDVLNVLVYLPTPILVVVSFVILWRCRRRSRKAATLAFAALCGLGGLWLFGMAFYYVVWENWRASLPANNMLIVLQIYRLIDASIEVVCALLLVLAAVTDRPTRGRDQDRVGGPAADFDDAPVIGAAAEPREAP